MKFSALCYADGDSKIGMGHLYRVLSIHQRYSKIIDFTFIISNKTQNDFFSKLDCKRVKLSDSKDLGLFDYGIYDSKATNAKIFYSLKSKASKWIGIDSIQSWIMDFDVAVYPSFYIETEDLPKKIVTSNVKKKFGVDYVLLKESKNTEHLKNDFKTLVSFGGSDPNNITGLISRFVNDRTDRNNFIFLIGPKFTKSISYFRKKFLDLHYLEPVESTLELIKKSDIIITAVGTTLQECEFSNKKTLIISNYKSDKNDIRKIKRSASEPSIYHFLNYFKDVDEESFNDSYNYLLNKNIEKKSSKNIWGRGWNELLNISEQ